MIVVFIRKILVFALVLSLCSGCDFIYGILQKEGAQEKKILGDVIPSVYNERVEYAQKLFLVNGFSCGKIDGKLGGKMRETIARFQEAKGLVVTRFLDDKTWAALNMVTATGLVKEAKLDLNVVQQILKESGFYTGTIDGKIGPKTIKAVKDFQKANGLNPDGRIGAKTLTKFNDFLLSR